MPCRWNANGITIISDLLLDSIWSCWEYFIFRSVTSNSDKMFTYYRSIFWRTRTEGVTEMYVLLTYYYNLLLRQRKDDKAKDGFMWTSDPKKTNSETGKTTFDGIYLLVIMTDHPRTDIHLSAVLRDENILDYHNKCMTVKKKNCSRARTSNSFSHLRLLRNGNVASKWTNTFHTTAIKMDFCVCEWRCTLYWQSK